jgi:hypothetical protein
VDVRRDLISDDGELGKRGIQHLPLKVLTVVQPVPEECGEDQEQREHRHESPAGLLRGLGGLRGCRGPQPVPLRREHVSLRRADGEAAVQAGDAQ